MTTFQDATAQSRPARSRWADAIPKIERKPRTSEPNRVVLMYSYVLTMVAVVLGTLIVNVTLVSQFQHFNSQHRLYDEFRLTLAEGSVPVGQLDVNGHLVKPGTPIALLRIPEIGLKEVVVSGTASRQTKLGVGHRLDTAMPGQAGASLLMGRAAAYGGPFGKIDQLKQGDEFTVQTGQGISTYRVIGPRHGTVQLPQVNASTGLLTLETASGGAFFPHGVLMVDAELVSKAFAPAPRSIAVGVFDKSEEPLAKDPSRLFSLSYLLQLLVLVTVGMVWAWKRWSVPAMWIVFVPVVAVVGLACADRICDLFPNLM